MPRRYYGSGYATQIESPLTQAMSGFSAGLVQGFQREQQKQEQMLSMKKQIMFGIANDEYDARIFASKEGQAFLKEAGLDQDKEIMDMVSGAAATIPPPPGKEPFIRETSTGALYQEPRAFAEPSADYVKSIMRTEAATRAMEIERQEQQVRLMNQIQLEIVKDGIKAGRMPTPKEQMEKLGEYMEAMGITSSDIKISMNAQGGVSISAATPDPAKQQIAEGRERTAEASYNTKTGSAYSKRSGYSFRLQALLRGDLQSADQLIQEGLDPAVAAAYQQVRQLIQGGSKDKVLESVTAVESMLKVINEEIRYLNKTNREYGSKMKDAKGNPLLSEAQLTAGEVKEITFDEIAGMSKEEYIKKKNPPDIDKAMDEARAQVPSSGPRYGGPSYRKAESEADKIKNVYEDIREVALDAMAHNPALSIEDILSEVMANKRELMAEYGLNERLFQILTAMAEQVLV